MKSRIRSKSIVKPGNDSAMAKGVAEAITKYLQRDLRPHRTTLSLNDGEMEMMRRAAKHQGLMLSTMVRACAVYGAALYLEAVRKYEDD